MATRLYLPRDGPNVNVAAPVMVPYSAWNDVSQPGTSGAGFSGWMMRPTKSATPNNGGPECITPIPGQGVGYKTLILQYITDPLVGPGTLSGNFKAWMGWSQDSYFCRHGYPTTALKIVSEDGQTVRGVLRALGNNVGGGIPYTTPADGGPDNRQLFSSAASLTPVGYLDRDRIVLEAGTQPNTTVADDEFVCCYVGDNSAADLPEEPYGPITGLDPWCEFSATLTFYPPPLPPKSVQLSIVEDVVARLNASPAKPPGMPNAAAGGTVGRVPSVLVYLAI